jgi:hypothetical protein
MPPKALITDPVVTAMGVIFGKGAKGETWAPRNQDALFQMVKGRVSDAPEGRSTYEQLVARFGEDRASVAKGLWVADGTPDGVDHDDDGAQDYEQILSILFGTLGIPSPYGWDWYCSQGGFINDIQRAMQITDIEMRSAAISIGIDNFLAALDDIRSGGDGTKKAAAIEAYKSGPATTVVDKAGARHSAADKARIDKIGDQATAIAGHAKALGNAKVSDIADHVAKIGDAAQAISDLHDQLAEESKNGSQGDGEGQDDTGKGAAVKALGAWTPGDLAEDGLPANYAERAPLVAKAASDDEKGEKPYGDVEYADTGYQDDKKKRYPVDTKAHAKAAWSYINQEKNASKYSAADLAKVKAAIQAACKKFGVETDDKSDKGAPTLFDGVVTLADGSTVTIKDGVRVDSSAKGAPATAPDGVVTAPAAIDVAALAASVAETLKGTVKSEIETATAALGERIGAIEATVAKGAPAPTPITQALEIIKAADAARGVSAPGGVATLNGEMTGYQPVPIIAEPTPTPLTAQSSLREVIHSAAVAARSVSA